MNLSFNIQMSDYELEASGSVITKKDANIVFSIQDLVYTFSFVNEENTPPQFRIKSNDGKRLELELVNFNNPLGMGNVDPFPMGRIGNRLLYIMIRVVPFDNGGKTLHYSWYSKLSESNNQ